MGDPVLTREVDLPRPRSSGAAIVAVASLAMFTAVGASAFVVRVRARMPIQRPVPAAYEQLQGKHECSRSRARARVVRDHFLTAVRDGDRATALRIYSQQMDPAMAADYAGLREEVALSHVREELARVALDTDAGRCEDAQRRLEQLRALLPDAESVQTASGACAPPARSVPVRLVP